MNEPLKIIKNFAVKNANKLNDIEKHLQAADYCKASQNENHSIQNFTPNYYALRKYHEEISNPF
jgi:hypothetical protein